MNRLALFLISLYQKYISPYKGYRCAYGVLHQQGTCSTRVSQVIRDEGLVAGWGKIKKQFIMCSEAYEQIKDKNSEKNKKKKDKDKCDCDPFDVLDCLPNPVKLCRGKPAKSVDGDCDLPCDCSL